MLTWSLFQSLIQQYQNDESISKEIVNYTPASTQFVNLNLKSENLKDVRVRGTLWQLDRDTICGTYFLFLVLKQKVHKSFIPSSESGYNESGSRVWSTTYKAKLTASYRGWCFNLTLTHRSEARIRTPRLPLFQMLGQRLALLKDVRY